MGWIKRVLGILVLVALATDGKRLCEQKCKSSDCMPSDQEWSDFASTLTGQFLSRTAADYDHEKKMWNGRVNKDPVGIVLVKGAPDIQKTLAFAAEHELSVSIRSSGFSIIGRSVEDNSLLISMEDMTNIDVRADDTSRSSGGEITVESGAKWQEVYKAVDAEDRVVVGGAAQQMGMGGFFQGGGNGPLVRSLGLASDNLLEAEIVTADGKWLTVSASGTVNKDDDTTTNDADLFWAIRGGGGGTWGVVVSFTFKMYVPPPQLVHFFAAYPMYYHKVLYGVERLQKLLPMIEDLPQAWGGYVVAGSESDDENADGGYIISLLYYGPWDTTDASFNAIWPIFFDEGTPVKTIENKTSFWDYQKDAEDPDSSIYETYLVNTLVQPGQSGDELPKVLEEGLFAALDTTYATTQCTFAMLGGKVSEPDDTDTPINPGYRSASFSLSCTRTWLSNSFAKANIDLSRILGCQLQAFGKGMYFSEPTEDLDWWKAAFWGTGNTYDRLLVIKKKWDPNNMFCCKNCVGYDLDPDTEPTVDPQEQGDDCLSLSVALSGELWLLLSLLAAHLLFDVG